MYNNNFIAVRCKLKSVECLDTNLKGLFLLIPTNRVGLSQVFQIINVWGNPVQAYMYYYTYNHENSPCKGNNITFMFCVYILYMYINMHTCIMPMQWGADNDNPAVNAQRYAPQYYTFIHVEMHYNCEM